MQRMRNLSQKQNECSETELNDRFKTVEMQVKEIINHDNKIQTFQIESI